MGFLSKIGGALGTIGGGIIGGIVTGGNPAGIAAGAGIGGSIGGANDQRRASDRASKAQQQAANAELAFRERQARRQDALLQPYVQLGERSIPGLESALAEGDTFGVLQDDPYGYNYLMGNPLFAAATENANRAITGNRAAQGLLNSPGTMDALTRNYLATAQPYWMDYLNAHSRLGGQRLDRALVPAKLGQASAVGQAANIGQFANQGGSLITQAGNARAAGIVGQQNADSAMLNNLLTIGTGAINSGLFDSFRRSGTPGWFESAQSGSDPFNIGWGSF